MIRSITYTVKQQGVVAQAFQPARASLRGTHAGICPKGTRRCRSMTTAFSPEGATMKAQTNDDPAQRETRNPVARAFAVLLWMVDAAGTSWALGEIAKGVAMHPSTLHRMLGHLQEGGIIQQDAETGRYSLGLGFLRLAWKAADHD